MSCKQRRADRFRAGRGRRLVLSAGGGGARASGSARGEGGRGGTACPARPAGCSLVQCACTAAVSPSAHSVAAWIRAEVCATFPDSLGCCRSESAGIEARHRRRRCEETAGGVPLASELRLGRSACRRVGVKPVVLNGRATGHARPHAAHGWSPRLPCEVGNRRCRLRVHASLGYGIQCARTRTEHLRALTRRLARAGNL